MNNPTLLKNLRNIPDFPIPGIQFKDVTTLFKSAKCMKIMVNELYDIYKDKGITKVVGIESRGFVVGAALAVKLGAGFVMCRKPGKLPAETLQESYMKEYGKDTIEIHKDAIDEKDVPSVNAALSGKTRAAPDSGSTDRRSAPSLYERYADEMYGSASISSTIPRLSIEG